MRAKKYLLGGLILVCVGGAWHTLRPSEKANTRDLSSMIPVKSSSSSEKPTSSESPNAKPSAVEKAKKQDEHIYTMTRKVRPQPFRKHLNPVQKPLRAEDLTELRGLQQGHWKKVKGLVAESVSQVSSQDRHKAVGHFSGYEIFETPGDLVQEEAFSSSMPMVVYNTRLEGYGVLTGSFAVTLKNPEDLANVLQDHGVGLRDSFEDIGLFFVNSLAEPFSLVQLKASLERDSRIQSVELEIVGKQYVKN